MQSSFAGPVNIGSEEMISINGLAQLVMEIAGKDLSIRNIPGPTGVRGRNSNNQLIRQRLGWQPSQPLRNGIELTYRWIERQVASSTSVPHSQSPAFA
jgi:nucleoside-diphosphate-sugar epimerase